MRNTLRDRVISGSVEGFESGEMRDVRNRLSEVFDQLGESVTVVVRSSEEESAQQESWFDREIVQQNETDDEIFEDAILCVDPYNKRF
jgi:hypothetical protein